MSKVEEISSRENKKNVNLYFAYKTRKGIFSEELLSFIKNLPTNILNIYQEACEEFKETVKYLLFK